ncbi:PA0069 family radical SAM protein [Iodidimonas sp. SYSU 1G8]|uniref:PA0069 family radical SAM protein n=1 Tax=Iodidimonas sp. SYSU 1G8 TaxID=3133967 RepID=UPI0031FF0CA5
MSRSYKPPRTVHDVQPDARRGRGSATRTTGRFERFQTQVFDDGWDTIDEEPPPLRTTVQPDTARTVISYNQSPDIAFDRSINPYRGCEHGCVYCFARPSHAYLGLSPGLDFESRLFAKFDAPEVLERELRRKGYKPAVIALGVNTDCYQPIERIHGITRRILEVLSAFNHPVTIITKSQLIQRDLDILADMASRNLVSAAVSLTSLDRALARRMEPRAATPSRRLATLEALNKASVPTTVMTAPLIPGLNDHEIDALLQAARDAGTGRAGYVLLRMPYEIKDLFRDWLEEHYPDRARKVINLVRSTRGGKDYDASFFTRGKGEGPYAELIAQRFQAACRRLGMDRPRHALDLSAFQPPLADGDQFSLF